MRFLSIFLFYSQIVGFFVALLGLTMYREFKADAVKLQANINHFFTVVGLRHTRSVLPQHDVADKQQHEESLSCNSSDEVELVSGETTSLLRRDEIKSTVKKSS